ncbi:MAG: xanthine dehydrogenase accessory protein XdhC [Xanthobacteraceae bacterium]
MRGILMSIWPTIERFVTEHGGAVLVTIAETQGSSPREAGARMVVRPDGGFSGTIGGGALEWLALAEAQSMLARAGDASFRSLDKALGPNLGQCCGGRVKLSLERFDKSDLQMVTDLAVAERTGRVTTVAAVTYGRPQREIAEIDDSMFETGDRAKLSDGRIIEKFGSSATALYLFGAGHVGRSLVLALAPLPFAVTWIDPRPNAFPPHVPANAHCIAEPEPAKLLADAPNGAFIAIMTHSHALDLDIAAAALRTRRFAYVGLIGSETKRARFVGTLRQLGVAQAEIDRLICPIGLTAIDDKSPAAIAASIAAQMLIVRGNPNAAQIPADARTTTHSVRHG